MTLVRAFGASLLVATTLLAGSQGCALFTCIEDCDSVSSSAGGGGGGGIGGNGEPTATASATGTNATSTGVGGEGGGPPCTDCPICSDELEGPAVSVAVLADSAYALVEQPGESKVFELPIQPGGFGEASPLAHNPFPANGRLVKTSTSVLHVSETLLRDIFADAECDTAHPIIRAAAAATGANVFVLSSDGLRTFNECFESKPDGDFAGAGSIATGLDRIAFNGSRVQTGPCVKVLPLVLSTPAECLDNQKPLAVSLIPSGKIVLFRDDSHVYSWEANLGASAELVADFDAAEEQGLPIAATSTEVFFARSTATETLWRCTIGQVDACRSAETETISSIHVDSVTETAYYTVGSRVCRWP